MHNMTGTRKHKGQSGIVPIARNASMWSTAAFAVLKWSIVFFTVLGFLAGLAGMINGGGITMNGTLMEGWLGVWTVTGVCSAAGTLFGLIWVLIFKTLALASKG